jgi:hypothetical protein
MPQMRFEPTTPVFEQAKTVYAFGPPGRCGRLHNNSYRKSMYNKLQVIFWLTKIQITAGVKVVMEANLIGSN